MRRRAKPALTILSLALLVTTLLTPGAEGAQDPAIKVPPGFTASTYARMPGLVTSISFGKDTRDGADGIRLYALDNSGGRVMAIDDTGGVGGEPVVFAEGFSNPLGLLATKRGVVYVADNESARNGPFGTRPYGRVWRVRDTDGDGTADRKKLVLKDLPNGRHNTNGMAIGPDGKLYVTNGNSTDDGVEGGEPEVKSWSGSIIRVGRRASKVSVASLPRRALVATGMRNIYDVAFSPVDRTTLFTPMNGVDDAREGSTADQPGALEDSDDLLLKTDVDDRRIDNFGFPSCLHNVKRQGDLKPYDNPNPKVIARFGRCRPRAIAQPSASFGLHPSSNGLAFQKTRGWGAEYRNDLFVAEFGNFFGDPAGHDVIHVELDPSGQKVQGQSEFFNAPLLIDLVFDRAGDMYVASFDGTIYKIAKAI